MADKAERKIQKDQLKETAKGVVTCLRERGFNALFAGGCVRDMLMGNTPEDYDPERIRRLLITKKEAKSMLGKSNESGLTVIPLRAYIKGRLVKLELGLGQHKTKADTREVIKKRETDRDIRRALKK